MSRKIREPVQKRALRTRLKLLSAARYFFSRRGFHGTRMDEVARRARVNKERIYAYFRSKQGLFSAVLQEAFQEVTDADAAFAPLADHELPFLAERLLRHYLKFHAEHPHFWRLLSWENLEGGRHLNGLSDIRQAAFQRLREMYGKGQAAGKCPADVSFETFIMVITAISFFFYSNQRTMSNTLRLDLADGAVRDRLVGEALRLLGAKQESQVKG